MGSILQPICKCNTIFNTLFVGGGMMNFETVCDVPTPCYQCGTIFTTNIISDKIKCPKCKRMVTSFGEVYDNRTFKKEINSVFDWGIGMDKTYILEEIKYKCPKCGEVELEFTNCGCWD